MSEHTDLFKIKKLVRIGFRLVNMNKQKKPDTVMAGRVFTFLFICVIL